jgi:hypothetical protein
MRKDNLEYAQFNKVQFNVRDDMRTLIQLQTFILPMLECVLVLPSLTLTLLTLLCVACLTFFATPPSNQLQCNDINLSTRHPILISSSQINSIGLSKYSELS